jgi:basic membrane protein A
MRTRSVGLTLFTGLAIFVAACTGGGASSAPSSAASIAPSAAASASPAESSAPSSVAPASAAPSEAAVPTCDTKLKVGLVTDVGRVNDKGFNQSAYEGMLAAAEAAPTCFETDYIETTSQSDYTKNIAEFTETGSDVVIGVGFLLGDALGDAAKEFPEIKFISVDGAPNPGHDEAWTKSGESLFFAEDQAGYLAGVLAASISKTNHIGVVGGLQVVPPVERFVEGYINGAKATKPDITVDHVYTTSFTDPPQGKNAAQQMLDGGADIIFGAGGLTGNGALEAACGKPGALAIGVDTDQYLTLPSVQKCIVSSATKNIVEAVKNSLLRIAAGQFTPGFHTDNAATNGIGLAPFHDQDANVPADVKTLLDETYKGLADGSISTGADKPDGKTP